MPAGAGKLRTIANARWSCTSCGECCRNILVPIEPELVARLKQARVETVWPPAAAQPWYSAESVVGENSALVLSQVDGHCVFLRDDNLCAIHALFGEEWKPRACRDFPVRLTRDSVGIAAVARPGCVESYMHWLDGEPVAAHGERRLGEQPPQRVVEFDREQVRIDGQLQMPLARWMETETAILRRLESVSGSIDSALATVRDMVYASTGRSPPVPSIDRYRVAVVSIIESLLFPLDAALRRRADSFTPEICEVAFQWLSRLERAWSAGTRPVLMDDECHAYLSMCLQGELLSKSCHPPDGIAAGLGQFQAGIHIVRACFEDVGETLTCERFAPLHARWLRFVSGPTLTGLVQRNPTALTNLFLNHAPQSSAE